MEIMFEASPEYTARPCTPKNKKRDLSSAERPTTPRRQEHCRWTGSLARGSCFQTKSVIA